MYNYRTLSSYDSTAIIVVLLVVLAVCLLTFIAWCRIFSKAGLPWERMFVPIYASYWTYKVADCSGFFWISFVLNVLYSISLRVFDPEILRFISLVYLVIILAIVIVFCKRLAKAFGKGGFFTLGLILLYPLFIMILGFGRSQYLLCCTPAREPVTETWTCYCGFPNPVNKDTCANCGAQKP